MNEIEQECKKLITQSGVNIASKIDYDVNGTVHSLSIEWIIDAYMQASKQSQEVFLQALQMALSNKEKGLEKFFEDMGQLILMTHLSDKLEVD